MKKILLFLSIFLLIFPLVSADIFISNWRLNKSKVYEGDEIVFSVSVNSENSIKTVFIEVIKTNSTNTTTSDVDLILVGSSTAGSWIKYFEENEGIYEITKIIAVDNTSSNSSLFMRDYGFLGFEVLKRPVTSTLPTTTSQNTTSTQITSSNQTTSSTSTTLLGVPTTVQSPKTKILDESFFKSPIFFITIILAAMIPIIFLILFIPRKATPSKSQSYQT